MVKKILLLFSLVFLLVECTQQQDSEKPFNIILVIGDGAGLTQISAGMYANGNSLAVEEFEFVGLSKTHAADALVTDSAASGTAMACGVKTNNGAIGVTPEGIAQKSILEVCQEKGYATALLATSSIVHATPASFYAKVPSRRQYEDIALQLREHSVDIFVGGGKKYFVQREDERNLMDEMGDYAFVHDLNAFEKTNQQKIAFLTYDEEPPKLTDNRVPALEHVVSLSLQKLAARNQPFFMMIEGSQIDWGGHANDLDYVISEYQEFNRTLEKVLAFAKKEGNTLVVVTADHETGGLAILDGNLKENVVKGGFTTKSHSATMVPVFSFGPHAKHFKGIYENTAIFDKMAALVEKQNL